MASPLVIRTPPTSDDENDVHHAPRALNMAQMEHQRDESLHRIQTEPLMRFASPAGTRLSIAFHEYREAFSRALSHVLCYDERIHGAMPVSLKDELYQHWHKYQDCYMSAAVEPAVSEEYADFSSEKAMREADVSRKRDLVALHAASFAKGAAGDWPLWLHELDQLVEAAQREWVEYLEFMDAATAPTVPPLPCLTCGCTRERDDDGERVCGCDSCQKNGCCYEPWDDEEECECCYRHDERKYAARQLAAEEEAADSYDGGYCAATMAATLKSMEV
jgi:hypothetical protein